jgi:hypothetical protein
VDLLEERFNAIFTKPLKEFLVAIPDFLDDHRNNEIPSLVTRFLDLAK